MPTFKVDGETSAYFVFNEIIVRFDKTKQIVIDQNSFFQNNMMTKLTTMLGFR